MIMNKHTYSKKPKLRSIPIVFLLIAYAAVAIAQDEDDDDIFELSPFEVDGTGDVGYAAQNTLAGSRMNSRLKDTPAPISVFTKEFLEDIGADNVEDILAYSVNMTPELSQDDGSFGGNQLTAFDARFRIRGLDADQARNYFSFNFDQDVFNMERVDESRGPNSILFGVGKAGGVINSSTKRPRLSQDSMVLNVTVGDADRFRTHIDYNKVLIENKFALRFNALYNESGDNDRPWLYRREDRYHLALVYRPTESTTLNFEYEYGDVVHAPTQPFGPSDRASTWIESGRPLAESGAGAAEGVSGSLGANYITYIDDSGTSVNLGRQRLTNSVVGLRDNHFTYDNNVINDPAREGSLLVPVDASLSGPLHMRGTRDVRLMSANLEQKFGENTFVELAWAKYEYDRFSHRIGGAQPLRGDANASLPDGSANPYAGELYFDARLDRDFRLFTHDYVRATLSHELKTDGWMGDHRLAAMYQTRESSFERNSQANVWLGAPTPFGVPFNRTPENGNNRVYYRNYVNNPTDKADWRVGFDPSLTGEGLTYTLPAGSRLYDGTTTTEAQTLTSGWVQNRALDETTEIDALMFAGQSYFLDDKLIVTYGVREDDFSFNSPVHFRNSATNQRSEINFDNALVNEFSASTETYGAVYHITDKISIAYNSGTNSGISDFSDKNVFGAPGESGAVGPVPDGESEDIAITFDLFNGKVFAKAAYFETSSNNSSAFLSWVDFNVISGVSNLYNIAFDAGFIDQATLDAQQITAEVGTFSDASEGYEFSVVGNINENWRISANYSYTNANLLQTFGEFTPWWEGSTGRSFFEQFDGNYVDPDSSRGPWDDGLNYGQAIDAVENAATLQQGLGGKPSNGQRHHKANIFTNYSFNEGVLKGFRVGGGARYTSGSLWNQVNPVLGLQEFGGQTLFDAVFGWRKKFDAYTLDLQLNIKNLFDNDNLQIKRLDDDISPDGDYDVFKYVLNPGRDIRLRASFRF